MKKETRAYLLDIEKVVNGKKLIALNVSELTDDEFIESAEQFGDVMTLSKLAEMINNDNIIMSDFYIRFIEVEIYELQLTIREWFDTLPIDLRYKALRNTDEWRMNHKASSFEEALKGSFVWKDTEEGHEFWEDIYDNHQEQLANDLWERSAE